MLSVRCSVRVWHFNGTHYCPYLRFAGFYPQDHIVVNEDNINRVMERELIRWRQHGD